MNNPSLYVVAMHPRVDSDTGIPRPIRVKVEQTAI